MRRQDHFFGDNGSLSNQKGKKKRFMQCAAACLVTIVTGWLSSTRSWAVHLWTRGPQFLLLLDAIHKVSHFDYSCVALLRIKLVTPLFTATRQDTVNRFCRADPLLIT